MLVRIALEGRAIGSATFQFVRHSEGNETVLCPLANEAKALEVIVRRSAAYGTKLTPVGDQIAVALAD